MKFTLSKLEVQTLLAKALNVPAEVLSVTVKELAVDIAQGVDTLSFGAAPAPVAPILEAVEEVAEEIADKPAPKAKASKKKAVKEVIEEEEIETAADIEEDDDDIDFL